MRHTLLAFLLVFALTAEAQKQRAAARHVVDETALSTNEWLQRHVVPFATTDARSGTTDLAGLQQIVGNSRIVSLGEATHGTREFFTMKHRVLEYVVEHMGFTVFAIEGALVESDAVNEYVQHGTGDPSAALAGIGFWTWNTDEVLDMILWMREYNLRRGDKPPVHFRGFDMQFSDHAMQALAAYLNRVDPAGAAALIAKWSCWQPFGRNTSGYSSRPASEKTACTTSLTQMYDAIAANRTVYTAASSAAEYETMLRYARVIVQHQAVAALAFGSALRDQFMAENTQWLAEVAHPGEKLVLWAHNYHVGRTGTTMGRHLGQAFPDRQMVVFGFVFDHGAFNARHATTFVLMEHRVESNPAAQFEPALRPFGKRLLLDLRDIRSGAARTFFHGDPGPVWSIGAVFESSAAANYRANMLLGATFDAIIWIEESTASRLRPF